MGRTLIVCILKKLYLVDLFTDRPRGQNTVFIKLNSLNMFTVNTWYICTSPIHMYLTCVQCNLCTDLVHVSYRNCTCVLGTVHTCVASTVHV